MTTTSVKDVGSVMNLGAAAVSAASRVKGDSFQNVWNAQTGKGRTAEQPDTDSQTRDSVKAEKAASPGDDLRAADRGAVRTDEEAAEAKVSEAKPPEEMSEEELEEAMEVVAVAAAGLMQQIADTFQMPLEEVEGLMAEMDLEPVDLLNPENLSNLILEAGGAQDSLTLLTDEQLYADFQKLMAGGAEAAAQAAEELQMTPEQMTEMVETVRTAAEENVAQAPKENVAQAPKEPIIEVTVQADEPEMEAKPVRQDAQTPVEGVQGAETQTVEARTAEPQTVEARTAEPQTTKTQTDEPQTTETRTAEPQTAETQTVVQKQQGAEENSSFRDSRQDGHERPEGNPILQTIRNEEFRPSMENVQETARTWDANTQDMMRQIMDYMRIQVRPGFSNLEMQLHPESLGNLHIQVASKGGVLTASFVTQNEAVKAALESQMVQLRESFEQQGVKVEAIEVTVQTHQFEENLEQGRGRQPQESGGRRGRTRRIDLNGEDFLNGSEELDEADQLTAEMMAADGNTVNYTA